MLGYTPHVRPPRAASPLSMFAVRHRIMPCLLTNWSPLQGLLLRLVVSVQLSVAHQVPPAQA